MVLNGVGNLKVENLMENVFKNSLNPLNMLNPEKMKFKKNNFQNPF